MTYLYEKKLNKIKCIKVLKYFEKPNLQLIKSTPGSLNSWVYC